MAPKLGDFVWYDIMTTDTAAATAFYEGVVGWTSADAGMPGMAYTLLSAGATPVCGLMALPPEALAAGAPPRWMGYICVDDVDAHADKVAAAGGAVQQGPDDIPGVGRFAYVADPHGAGFYLFKGDGDAAQAAPHTQGHVGWNELYAGDGASAFAFYAGLFGWIKDQAIPMGPMGVYQTFAADGVQIGGVMTRMAHQPKPYWLYYFNVDAIDAAATRVTEAGGQVTHGPTEVPGGQWIVQCTDPQGAMFALVAAGR